MAPGNTIIRHHHHHCHVSPICLLQLSIISTCTGLLNKVAARGSWGFEGETPPPLQRFAVELDQRFITELAHTAALFSELFQPSGRKKLLTVPVCLCLSVCMRACLLACAAGCLPACLPAYCLLHASYCLGVCFCEYLTVLLSPLMAHCHDWC